MLTTARHANLAESFINSTYRKGLLTLQSRHVVRFGSNSVLLFIGEDCGSTSLPATNHVHNESPRLIAMAFVATTLQWYLGDQPNVCQSVVNTV
jgi:hypothetical protein